MLVLTRQQRRILATLLLLACVTILVLAALLAVSRGAAHLDVWHLFTSFNPLAVQYPRAMSPHG